MTAVLERIPSTSLDPFSDEFFADPYPRYEELRELGPAFFMEKYGVYGAARHADVMAILLDPATFISGAGAGIHDLRKGDAWRPPSILLEADPPLHDQTRGVMNRVLSGPAIRRLREPFQRDAEAMVSALVERERFDAVPDLGQAYPLKVVGDAVGVPVDGRECLLPYANMLFNSFGPENEIFKTSIAEAGKVVPLLMAQCQPEVLAPGSFGADIYKQIDEGRLPPEYGPIMVRSLLSAGFDTTVNGITSMLWGFACHPEQWDKVRANPALHKTAFDEVLRWESPAQTFFRTTSKETSIGGMPVPKDAKVLMFLGSANRDPRKWDHPEALDVTRNSFGHVALGYGIHQCVGMMIARLEAEMLIGEFAKRVKRFELDGEPVRRPNNTLRGFAKLPIRVVPL
jgi:cytochrome P450